MALSCWPALAAQDDPRLDDLFARLQQSRNGAEAARLEGLIWAIWFRYDGEDEAVPIAMRRGVIQMRSGDTEAAELSFGEAVEAAPDFAEAWNQRATVRYIQGDYVGSIADIRAVLALEPRHFGALSGLGLCYQALDRLEEALAAYEAAQELDPNLRGIDETIETLRERIAGEPI